jgi:hypothetical protein
MDSGRAARIRSLLAEGIDWDYLLQTAISHDLISLLHWNLHATCPDAVPAAIQDWLQKRFDANAWHNLFLTQELHKLLDLLEGHGISAVPLKGPVLAASVYGNLALREFCDLDILVRQRDVLRARDAIISCGYRPCVELDEVREAAWLRSHRELKLDREDGEAAVDLQWHIPSDWRTVRSFPLDPEGLWERLEPFSLAGTAVPAFSPEDLLLVLSVHAASHGWRELKLVCDVAELIRCHPQVDLQEVLARAGALGVERMVSLGLLLASELLGTALPSTVLHRARADPAIRALAAQVREWAFCVGEEGYLVRRLKEAVFSIRLRERWRDRIPFVLHFVAYPRRAGASVAEERALRTRLNDLSF